MRMRRGLFSALPLLFALLTATDAAAVGLRSVDGGNTTLADQVPAGRWTLVFIWTTYCGTCRHEYPMLSAFHDAHAGRDAAVVGIALDGYAELDTVRRYLARKPFTFDSVVGEPAAVGKAFETATGEPFTGTPSYLLFNPERQLVAATSGALTREALEKYIAKETP